MIQPGIGRIVLYRPHGVSDPETHAAIVIAVQSERSVSLACFSHEGTYYHRANVQLLQDDDIAPPAENGYAEWMPFQKGQVPASSAVDERLKRIEALLITDGPVHQTLSALHERLDKVEAVQAAAPVPDAPLAPAPQGQDPSSAGQQQQQTESQPAQPDPAATQVAQPQVQA